MDVEQQGLEPLRHFDNRILPSLDGLRGIAVLLVLAYHNVSVRIPGPMGVEIFFVLSGFLITKLLLKEVDDTGTISIRSFYWRRALRIFPAFYVYMLLVALVDHVTPAYYWSGMTYTINYYVARHGNQGATMYHLWSLAVEEQFYLIWPFTFFMLRHRITLLTWVTGSFIAASQVYKALIFHHVSHDHIYRCFDTRGPEILMGCWLALALYHRERVPKWLLARPVLIAALSELSVSGWFSNEPSVAYLYVFDSIAISILLMQAIHYAPKILNTSPLRFVGRISYSLYLYHPMAYLAATKLRLHWGVTILISVTLAVCAATISRYTFEAWFMRLKRRVKADRPTLDVVPAG